MSAAYVEVCDLVYIQCMTSLPHDGERVRTARALGAFEVSRRFSEHRLSSARTSSLACPLAPALEMMQEPLRSVELVADRCRGTRLERCSVASLAADRHQGSSFGPGYSAARCADCVSLGPRLLVSGAGDWYAWAWPTAFYNCSGQCEAC